MRIMNISKFKYLNILLVVVLLFSSFSFVLDPFSRNVARAQSTWERITVENEMNRYLTPDASGSGAVNWDEGSFNTLLEIPPAVINLEIVAGADDATENARNTLYTGGDLRVRSYPGATPYQRTSTGLRFRNVDIPQGSNINDACISIYPFSATSNDVNCRIYFENIGDSQNFIDNPNIIEEVNRPRTLTSVSWVEDDIAAVQYVDSPSLGVVMQELVSRPDWEAGNALTVLMIANEDIDRSLRFWNQEKYLNVPAKLHVEYHVPNP